jgi:hypothetical protein
MSIWFRKGIEPGNTITLDQPVPSQWQIVEKLNEEDFQQTEAEHRRWPSHLSYVTTKFICRDRTDHTKDAFMRIYLQVPYRGTEIDDPDTRATQATTIVPEELIAYQELTQQKSSVTPKLLGHRISKQDKSGPVPGGFVVCLLWEMVPGRRLGSKDSNDVPDLFWTLDAVERNDVRMAFMKSLK